MDERKPDHLKPVPPSLRSAIRRARVESAEQSEAVADLREAEIARLELLLEAIRPVLDQTPEGVELFDPGIARGDRPRLFLDMISFVDLGHDRRTYRFFQDTRHGRVLIAESALIERIVAAMTNYVARRLVEREQALASDWRSREAPSNEAKASSRVLQSAGAARARDASRPPADGSGRLAAATGLSRKRRGWLVVAGDLFSFLLLTLGSVTFVALVCLGAYAAWNAWGRALWTAWFGPPPI
ncbi:MAG TPA: hypothetical protein VEF36_16290 [Roseiarcus sp.]|nr:hypothetical protein [Roseiarcus sp.]